MALQQTNNSSSSSSSIPNHPPSTNNPVIDRRISKSKKKSKANDQGDVGGIGVVSKKKGEGGSKRISNRDNDSDSDNEETGGGRASDVLGPLMVEVLHTDTDGSQRRSFIDPSSPVLSPHASKSPSRRGSSSLSRTNSFGSGTKPSPAHNVRRNSQRRVSELIREARQPSGTGTTPTTSTNMAINLTETHAFTSSIGDDCDGILIYVTLISHNHT